jgi:SAM-dependent methyltransferase
VCSPKLSHHYNYNCLACGRDNLELILDLGMQPPANSYKDHPGDVQQEFPLAINLCKGCYHVQLTHTVDPDILYKDYLYVSGTSQTMMDHFKWFADYAHELHQLVADDLPLTVLDIGCNDGSQLDAFKARGYQTHGIDPATNLHATSTAKGHEVVCGYFDDAYVQARKVEANNYIRKFDVITAQNVFAHNPDPLKFLETAKKLLWYDGLMFIQTSQADMILNNEFDTIYHEHVNFFNINSMNELCKRAGMYLVDVTKCPLHGNSYIFVLSTEEERGRPAHIANLIEMERKAGLMDSKTYKAYAEKCKKVAREFKNAVEDVMHPLVGWFAIGIGAAAKGNTLLNYTKVKLDFIVDDNPLKQGKFTPGMSIPIVSADELKNRKDTCLLVPLAWNFFDEIKKKVEAKKPYNEFDLFLRYFPIVKTEPRTKFQVSPGVVVTEMDVGGYIPNDLGKVGPLKVVNRF